MKREKISQKPYLKDSEVYTLWKYLNGNLTSRNVFQFDDLKAPNTSKFAVMYFIANLFDRLGINIEKPIFNKDIYLQFYGKRKDAKKAKQFLKILDDDFNVAELKNNAFLLEKYGALEFIEFEKGLTKKNHDRLAEYFDFYIDQFIADDLVQDDSNYLKFELQKQKTLGLINNYKEKYGNEFILKYEPISSEFSPYHDTFLFIHSIIALEKLGDIKVNNAWFHDEVPPDEQTNDFKIKLIVLGQEIKEIEQKKFSPILKVEGNTGYFKFYKEGPKIEIGKVGTRKYRLLVCLLDTLKSARTVDSVFEAIKISKDKSDTYLSDPYISPSRKLAIIQNTMKELQKIEGLTGKVVLEFPHGNRTVLLKFKP